MPVLLHGDCLELMKDLDDESVDLIFCDLPYGCTSCVWDCKIDLKKFWIEIMRIKKLNTPIFFTTTTKFGVDLIKSAPKKCFFRYDLVWVKSAAAGFLSAKKMPMRKHEMIYVFYEKLPFYDLSSHKHKFIKQEPEPEPEPDFKKGTIDGNEVYKGKKVLYRNESGLYNPPLPVSVVKEQACYGIAGSVCYKGQHNLENGMALNQGGQKYNPPLPNSMLEIKSTRGKHSTEKPVALMSWILKYYSKEGDVVLDPTCGSGSTGVACKNMNREFIGMEMDAEIYEVACERVYD